MELNYQKKKDFMVCVDSDGCVIDGMTVKHVKCFGPCLVNQWHLEEHREEVMKYWLKINLYSETRGVNRFIGLLDTLEQCVRWGYLEVDTEPLARWVRTTTELSAGSLRRYMESEGADAAPVLGEALSWSDQVNEAVRSLSDSEKLVFANVKECFEALKGQADLGVVSSANGKAVEDEWNYNGVLSYVDVVMTQEHGSKADCLKLMKDAGYAADHILMVGDSPGDITSAEKNGVLYYPLVVGAEPASWKRLAEEILPLFFQGTYASRMEQEKLHYFEELKKLSGE